VLDGWRVEDAAASRRLSLDPDAARFFGWTVKQAREQPDAYYEDHMREWPTSWQNGKRFNLALRQVCDGEAVGSVELRPSGSEAEVSYCVDRALRRRGLASRALEAMLAWGVQALGLTVATLDCHVENIASRRVAEKCGFTLIEETGDSLKFRRELVVPDTRLHA
jgi:RimJ/RimL family protein N-acetyltransferase